MDQDLLKNYPDITEILNSNDHKGVKINKLQKMLLDERAIQRAATESNMVADEEAGSSRLQVLEQILDEYGVDTTMVEDGKAATL